MYQQKQHPDDSWIEAFFINKKQSSWKSISSQISASNDIRLRQVSYQFNKDPNANYYRQLDKVFLIDSTTFVIVFTTIKQNELFTKVVHYNHNGTVLSHKNFRHALVFVEQLSNKVLLLLVKSLYAVGQQCQLIQWNLESKKNVTINFKMNKEPCYNDIQNIYMRRSCTSTKAPIRRETFSYKTQLINLHKINLACICQMIISNSTYHTIIILSFFNLPISQSRSPILTVKQKLEQQCQNCSFVKLKNDQSIVLVDFQKWGQAQHKIFIFQLQKVLQYFNQGNAQLIKNTNLWKQHKIQTNFVKQKDICYTQLTYLKQLNDKLLINFSCFINFYKADLSQFVGQNPQKKNDQIRRNYQILYNYQTKDYILPNFQIEADHQVQVLGQLESAPNVISCYQTPEQRHSGIYYKQQRKILPTYYMLKSNQKIMIKVEPKNPIVASDYQQGTKRTFSSISPSIEVWSRLAFNGSIRIWLKKAQTLKMPQIVAYFLSSMMSSCDDKLLFMVVELVGP